MIGGGLGPLRARRVERRHPDGRRIAQVAATAACATTPPSTRSSRAGSPGSRGGATDVGTQTRRCSATVAGGARPGQRGRPAGVVALHAQTGQTAGNGSLMRTAPVALAFLDDPAALTARPAAISGRPTTTRSRATRASCGATRSGWPSSTARCPTWWPRPRAAGRRRTQWAAWIADAERRTSPAFAPNGYVVTALQAAWSAIRHPLGDDRRSSAPWSRRCTRATTPTRSPRSPGHCSAPPTARRPCPEQWLADVHGWPGLRADGPARPRAAGGRPLTAQPRRTPVTLPARDSSTVISTRCLPGFFAQ